MPTDNAADNKVQYVLKPSFDLKSDGGLTQWQLRDTVIEEGLLSSLYKILGNDDPNYPGKLRRSCRSIELTKSMKEPTDETSGNSEPQVDRE